MDPMDMILWLVPVSGLAFVVLRVVRAHSHSVLARYSGRYTTAAASEAMADAYYSVRIPSWLQIGTRKGLWSYLSSIAWPVAFAGFILRLDWLAWTGLALLLSPAVPTLASLSLVASANLAARRRGRERNLFAAEEYSAFRAVADAIAIRDGAAALYWLAEPFEVVSQLLLGCFVMVVLPPLRFLVSSRRATVRTVDPDWPVSPSRSPRRLPPAAD